jgi:ribosomal protein L34E
MKMARFKNLPKSQKRPERPYGGNLCPSCLKLHAKQAIFAAKP